MSTEIVPYVDMQRMAVNFARSGLFGVKTPDQALALMLVSQAEGRHPALAALDYNIIQGRPSKTAIAMLRDFQLAGGKIGWRESSDTVAVAEFTHPAGGSVTIKWDMAMAKRAGLADREMWKKYPRQMLRSRCVSEGVRAIFPAATSGMYVPEEVRDIAAEEAPGVTIDNTADVLDQFAAKAPEGYADRDGVMGATGEYLLGLARETSLRGPAVFRKWCDTLTEAQRQELKDHIADLWKAAKQAEEDPFGLPPLQTDLLNTPPEEPTR